MTAFRDAYLAGYRAAIHDADNELRLLMSEGPPRSREDRVIQNIRLCVSALANDPDVPEEKP